MFNNIGNKIKATSIVFFVISVIASIIAGVLVLHTLSIIYGMAIIGIGIIISWVIAIIFYGFGELVKNSSEIKEALSNINSNPTTTSSSQSDENSDQDDGTDESNPLFENVVYQCGPFQKCLKCGERKYSYYICSLETGAKVILCPNCYNLYSPSESNNSEP